MTDRIKVAFDEYLAFLDSVRTFKTARSSAKKFDFNQIRAAFEKHWLAAPIPNEVVSILSVTKEDSGVIDPFEFCNESRLVDLWNLRLEMQSENSTSGFPKECIRPKGSIKSDLDWRTCLLYTSPSPRDRTRSRMPSSA